MDGLDRLYLIHVPPGYDRSRPPPVVLAFHGTPSDAAGMKRITDFDRLADARGFVAVYPEAAVGDWATGCIACPSAADHARIDDVGFVRRIVTRLAAELPIDRRRVHAVGFSNGALFANRLACDAADLLAGAALVGATLLDDDFVPPCQPARPIPMVVIHGDRDPSFPPEGRAFGAEPGAPRTVSIASTLAAWERRNDCAAPAPAEPLPEAVDDGTRVFVTRWVECDGDAKMWFFAVGGGGHTWPGSPVTFDRSLGPKSRDFDASAAIVTALLDR